MSITGTPQPDHEPPRVLVTIALGGVTPVPAEVTVYRVDSEGRSPLRSGEPAVLSAGGWADYDYEAPFGEAVTYEARTEDGQVWRSDLVTLEVADIWLRHPAIPNLSMRMPAAKPGTLDVIRRQARRGVHRVVGRARPVVATSGVRDAEEFTLVLRTYSDTERQMLLDLLDDQTALLIGCSPALGWRLPQRYVSVGDVEESQLVAIATDDRQTFVLPCMVVDRPAGAILSQWTFDAIGQAFPTINDVMDAYETINDLGLDQRRPLVPDA